MSDDVEPNDDIEPDEDAPTDYRPTRGVLSQEDYEGASDDSDDNEEDVDTSDD